MTTNPHLIKQNNPENKQAICIVCGRPTDFYTYTKNENIPCHINCYRRLHQQHNKKLEATTVVVSSVI